MIGSFYIVLWFNQEVKAIKAEEVSILDTTCLIWEISIDPGFNLLDDPWGGSSDRAALQFALTSGSHISLPGHTAASLQTTAEPEA